MQARDGNFYGTCQYGGATTNQNPLSSYVGYGSVFKMTPDGTISTLASFYGTNGMHPQAGLVEADDGNFYGTTYDGGAYPGTGIFGGPGAGTIFRITADGTLTTLFSFWPTNGANPATALTKGPDGVLYGTTRAGGSSYGDPSSSNSFGCGTLFKITTNGDFTSLYSFTCGLDGYWPFTSLGLASDGNFYGVIDTTSSSVSRIFRLALDGTVTPVAPPNALVRSCSGNPLIETRDGQLCGASLTGGPLQFGGVYKVSLDGTETILATFTDSGACFGSLVEGTDGSIYGVRGNNSVVRIKPDGSYGTILSLSSNYFPVFITGLIQGKDGGLYSTGDGYGSSTQPSFVVRISIASAAEPKLRTPSKSGNSIALSWSAIAGRTYQVQSASNLSDANWANVSDQVTATGAIAGTSDPIADTARFYRVVMLP